MFQTTLCNLSVRNRGIYYKNDIFVMVSDNSVKDVTARYSSQWLTHTRKNRIDPSWWTETLMAFDSTSYNDNLLEDDEIKSRRLFYISSIFHSSSLSCLLPLFFLFTMHVFSFKKSVSFLQCLSVLLSQILSPVYSFCMYCSYSQSLSPVYCISMYCSYIFEVQGR